MSEQEQIHEWLWAVETANRWFRNFDRYDTLITITGGGFDRVSVVDKRSDEIFLYGDKR